MMRSSTSHCHLLPLLVKDCITLEADGVVNAVAVLTVEPTQKGELIGNGSDGLAVTGDGEHDVLLVCWWLAVDTSMPVIGAEVKLYAGVF